MGTPLLLIDDDLKLNTLLRDYLAQFEFTVHCNPNPIRALSALKESGARLVILDVMLPEKDGFQVCTEIRRVSQVPIIMLTARDEVSDRVVGFQLGADDYRPKPFEPRELVARIQAILRRTMRPVATDELACDGLRLNIRSRMATLNNCQIELTSSEFDILEFFMQHPREVISRERLLDELRGIDWEAYNRSIDVGMSRLRQRLSDNPKQPRFFRTVRGAGYLFIGEVHEGGAEYDANPSRS